MLSFIFIVRYMIGLLGLAGWLDGVYVCSSIACLFPSFIQTLLTYFTLHYSVYIFIYFNFNFLSFSTQQMCFFCILFLYSLSFCACNLSLDRPCPRFFALNFFSLLYLLFLYATDIYIIYIYFSYNCYAVQLTI